MVRDALRGYLSLATGLTEVTRARATAAAKSLAAQGEATAAQVGGLAEDLLSTSRSNRAALSGLVRVEVDRALERAGLARSDVVAALVQRIHSLEQTLRDVRSSTTGTTKRVSAPRSTAKRTAAKRPAAAKTATKGTAKRTAAAKRTATKRTAKRTATKRTAKRTATANSAAKRTTATKRTPAKSAASTRKATGG